MIHLLLILLIFMRHFMVPVLIQFRFKIVYILLLMDVVKFHFRFFMSVRIRFRPFLIRSSSVPCPTLSFKHPLLPVVSFQRAQNLREDATGFTLSITGRILALSWYLFCPVLLLLTSCPYPDFPESRTYRYVTANKHSTV